MAEFVCEIVVGLFEAAGEFILEKLLLRFGKRRRKGGERPC